MKPEDREAFLEIVIGFAELKGKQLSAPAYELYWNAMQDWEFDDFKQAANHLLKSTTFMPTPKDFEDLRKAGRPTAGECWERAVDHAANSRFRHGLKLDEMTERVVAQIGGYIQIADCPPSKLPFLEQRFAKRFEEFADVYDTREALPSLTLTEVLKLRHDDPQLE